MLVRLYRLLEHPLSRAGCDSEVADTLSHIILFPNNNITLVLHISVSNLVSIPFYAIPIYFLSNFLFTCIYICNVHFTSLAMRMVCKIHVCQCERWKADENIAEHL